MNYNRQQTDVFFDVTSKLTVRGGYRYVWGDATVLAGTLSQTGPLASGELNRNVGLAGVTIPAVAEALAQPRLRRRDQRPRSTSAPA